jgi:hypothetical protein
MKTLVTDPDVESNDLGEPWHPPKNTKELDADLRLNDHGNIQQSTNAFQLHY